jgi:hypothetical protein
MCRTQSRTALVAIAFLLVSACGIQDPVASEGTLPGGAVIGRSLEAEEAAEKEGVARRQEADAHNYDSLKVEWQKVLDDTTGRYDDILVCDPIQYVATVKIVGPEGGDINFGPHTLRIPPGALARPTVITAEAPSALQVVSRFSPHGTRFQEGRHPTLELSYKHCRGPLNREARIAYVGLGGEILEWPPSEDVPDDALVRARIGHFSGYIVAY